MRKFASTAVSLALLASAAPAWCQTSRVMRVVVTPSAMDQAVGKGEVAVEMTLPDLDLSAETPLFLLTTSVPGLAKPQVVRDLVARDSSGAVSLRLEEQGGNARWIATRAIKGNLDLRYTMAIENSPMLQGGPPTAPRLDGRGFSTIGDMLLLTPLIDQPMGIALHWDLTRMGPGAEAVSSFGNGDVRLPVGPANRLARGVYMAGKLFQEPEAGVSNGFSSVWAGDPGFDPRPIMKWTGKLHGWMSRFFRDESIPPYRVFLRYNPMNAGGGAALYRSFIVTYGTGVTGESLKRILGHEMTHTWTANGLGKWYSEGNAVYYQALLAWRAGLIGTRDYLADINATASRYYTNALLDTPEEEAVRRFWEDSRVRVLPYDRGAIYFAVLNGKIRRASRGKRSIDDLVHAMIARAKANQPINEEIWLDHLRAEIGEEGPRIHRAMTSGALMLPESGDYGPCFRRTVRKIRRFELGFDPKSLLGTEKVIRGLVAGSEAEKAGLREGDRFSYGVSMDAVQGDVARTLTFQVTRDGRTFPVTYLPRGEAVQAYQWERAAGVPESRCKA